MANELPVEYDPSTGWPLPNQTVSEYVPPVEPKRKNYIIEPDLYGYQTGNYVPEGATVDETGNLFWKDTKEPIQIIRRPTLLPVVGTPDGNELVMPKLADLAGYVMGPLAAGKVPVKAGEMVLGSGAVRSGKEFKYPLAKPAERWSNTLGQNDHLLETMTPDEFLSKGRPLKIDAESRETINGLKQHIEEGKPLDPLELHANGKEDGRHRAIAAKELGIKEVPVLNFREPEIAPTFYSGLERAVSQAKPTIATADQWLGYLKNQPGVKAEELQHVLSELPNGPITKEALGDIVKANKVELKEIVKGGKQEKNLDDYFSGEDNIAPLADTKFHQYQLPGGENYKELLLTLPVNEKGFNASTMNDIAKELGYGGWTSNLTAAQKAHVERIFDNQKMNPAKRFERMNEIEQELQNRKSGEEDKRSALRQEYKELADMERKSPSFKSSHWNEPNVLAHIRMNDRNVEGNKTLHLEEIQSDWHQKGRKEGYKLSEKEKARLDTNAETVDNKLNSANAEDIMGNPDPDAGLKQAVERKLITQKEADDYRYLVKNENGTVPDAPFKKNWDELAFKRAIRHAAENGYDAISWTPGEAQAARYDLSKTVKGIHWQPSIADKNSTLVQINPTSGDPLKLQVNKKGIVEASFPSSRTNQFEGKSLADVVGKEHADKILGKSDGSMEGEGLKIGGEGMKAFYDKMLVDRANALGKKYGAKVEQKKLPLNTEKKSYAEILKQVGMTSDEWNKLTPAERASKLESINFGQPIHYLPLTPELKQKALTEGFPLFTSSPTIIPVDFDPFERNKKFKLVPVQGNPFQ